MLKTYLILIAATIFEVSGTMLLPVTKGFTKPVPTGALIFFALTNFGVWLGGSYGYSLNGIINCFILAIPFFAYSIISTLIFSIIIETAYRIYQKSFFNIKI